MDVRPHNLVQQLAIRFVERIRLHSFAERIHGGRSQFHNCLGNRWGQKAKLSNASCVLTVPCDHKKRMIHARVLAGVSACGQLPKRELERRFWHNQNP